MSVVTPSTDQVTFSEDELLATHEVIEPLIAGGVVCHGGFDADGAYVSPRTRNRVPAISAWDAQRAAQFGTPKLDIGLDSWPEHFPNVAQTRLLHSHGVTAPTITELTRIGTVEGFGAMLRYSPIPDMRRAFAEEIDGTAIAHLGSGLYEAHARDEAGFESEGGHKQMWFAARDVAFDSPVTGDQTNLMLERMGIPLGDPEQMAKLRKVALAMRQLPEAIDFEMESLVARMIRLLFIEISAAHVFSWAETVLADDEYVAGAGEAAHLVSYIRQDEAPHVGYLGTVLSEMRDRTWIGTDGSTYAGADMIERMWNAALVESTTVARAQFLEMTVREITSALDGRTDADALWEELLSLGTVRQTDGGEWTDDSDRRVVPTAHD